MNLRPALILATEAEYDLREVSFRAWRIRAPQEADAVLLALETCLLSLRPLGPHSPMPTLRGVGSTSRQQPKGGQ